MNIHGELSAFVQHALLSDNSKSAVFITGMCYMKTYNKKEPVRFIRIIYVTCNF
jgi:hypothetical protein